MLNNSSILKNWQEKNSYNKVSHTLLFKEQFSFMVKNSLVINKAKLVILLPLFYLMMYLTNYVAFNLIYNGAFIFQAGFQNYAITTMQGIFLIYFYLVFVKMLVFFFLCSSMLTYSIEKLYSQYFARIIFYVYFPLVKLFHLLQLTIIVCYLFLFCIKLCILCLQFSPLIVLVFKDGLMFGTMAQCAPMDNNPLVDIGGHTGDASSIDPFDEDDEIKEMLELLSDPKDQLDFIEKKILSLRMPDLKPVLTRDDLNHAFIERGPDVSLNIQIAVGKTKNLLLPQDLVVDKVRQALTTHKNWVFNAAFFFDHWSEMLETQRGITSQKSSVYTCQELVENNMGDDFFVIKFLSIIPYNLEQRVVEFERVFNRLNQIFVNLEPKRYCFRAAPAEWGDNNLEHDALERLRKVLFHVGPHPSIQWQVLSKTALHITNFFEKDELHSALFKEGFEANNALTNLNVCLDQQVWSPCHQLWPDQGGRALARTLDVWLGVLNQQRQPTLPQIYEQFYYATVRRLGLGTITDSSQFSILPSKVTEINSTLTELSMSIRKIEQQNKDSCEIFSLRRVHDRLFTSRWPEGHFVLTRLNRAFSTEGIDLQQQTAVLNEIPDPLFTIISNERGTNEEAREIILKIRQRIPQISVDENQTLNNVRRILNNQFRDPFLQAALLEEIFLPLISCNSNIRVGQLSQAFLQEGFQADQSLEDLRRILHQSSNPKGKALEQVLQVWKAVLSQQWENPS